MLRVKDCLQVKPPAVTPRSTLRETVELMIEHKLDGLAVVDETNHLLGVITLGYLLRGFMPEHLMELPESMQDEVEAVNVQAFFGPSSVLFLVDDFFKHDVEPLQPADSLMFAAAEMERQQLSFLPVVDKKKFVGVISRCCIMQGFFNLAP